jgi:hypothetical protein
MKAILAALLALPALACLDVGSLQGPRPPTGTGGAAGAACASCSAAQCTSPPDNNPNLVAGLESGCDGPEVRNGRSTHWFTYASGQSVVQPSATASFVPSCVGANGSCYAACISGLLAGNSYPYAGLGVGFGPGTFDLSAFAGVSFYVLGTIGSESGLRFSIPTIADSSVGTGGTCASGDLCNDAYQIPVPGFQPVGATTAFPTGSTQSGWQKVTVTFDMLTQVGWGLPEAWDPAHVVSLSWGLNTPLETLDTDQDFTVCIDQIELIPR